MRPQRIEQKRCTAVTKPADAGFTVIEVAAVLFVVMVLVASLSIAVPAAVDGAREDAVRDQLLRLKRGIVGNPATIEPGQRNINRFGFVGDMGSLPASLDALVEAGALPNFQVQALTQLAHGWRGPYLATEPLPVQNDPWGQPVVFDTTPGTSALTGAPVVATLRSAGPDGTMGTADDAMIEICKGEAFSRVFGYLRRRGNAVPGVDVKLHYPSGGVATSMTVATDDTGFFEFANVPHGDRVFEVAPKLNYVDDSAFATENDADSVVFVVENLGKTQTDVTSFTLTYTSNPDAYYRRVRINGTEVRDTNNPRAGSGTVVTFSNRSVAGTGVDQEPLHALVSSEIFHVPDISIGTVGAGGRLTIELEEFDDVQTGNGTAVDMTGITFKATFSDGSVTYFTAKAEP